MRSGRGLRSVVFTILVAAAFEPHAVAFVFPAGPPAPKPPTVDPTLQGLWTVSGALCGDAGANAERVRVTQAGGVATAVTLTGDACVPAGGIVWTGKVPPRPAPGVPRSDGHATALRLGAREILLFTAGPECCVQAYAYDATNDEAAVLLLPGATSIPGPVTPWLYGEPDAKLTSVLVRYFQEIAGPLRPVARGGWAEDSAATAAALGRAGQDEVRAGRGPRTVDEAVELERKREAEAALRLAGDAVQPMRSPMDGNLPETFPARKVVSMPGFIHVVVPAGFHARAADAAQVSLKRIGQEANEEVHFSMFPFNRAGSLMRAADMTAQEYMISVAARGGDYREEKRAMATCGGDHIGIRTWASLRTDAGGPVLFMRSCLFVIGQKVFQAGYMVTADRIAVEGSLLDAIMKSAAFGDAADAQSP